MKVKLTDRFCANVKNETRTDYFDEDTTGLALRVSEQGRKSWTFHYTVGDKRQRLSLGTYPATSLGSARTKAIEARCALEEGADPHTTVPNGETLEAVCKEFLIREGKKLRTADWIKKALERLVYPVLGQRPIRDIRRSEIVSLLDQIEDDRGPVMATRTLEIIRRVMAWHSSRTDDFNSPIVRGMKRTKTSETARDRILSDEELRAVWTTADRFGVFGDLVQFILLTATRRTEAAHMRRGEVTGADWIIPGARYKTKLDHLVPLSAAALALLPTSGDWIFTTTGNRPIGGYSNFKREFDKLTGVAGYTLHDLRRTARSLMSRAGVSADIAERCLGHVMGGVRGTYDRYEYRDEKAQAFEALASLIDRIVNPQDNVVPMRAANG
jgi:integrase